MKTSFLNRWAGITKNSDSTLLKRLDKSLDRDRDMPDIHKFRKALIYFRSLLMAPFHLRSCNTVGKYPRTRCRPNIENMGEIHIGNEVNINSRNVQTDLVANPGGKIIIGDEVSINFGVSIVANKRVEIGNRIRIGPYSMIYDSNQHVHGVRFERAKGKPVVIEDDVWITSRVIILEGTRIGKGSLIAANSVVSGFIPPYCVAAGIPAKVIKFLKPPEDESFAWEEDRMKKREPIPSILDNIKVIESQVARSLRPQNSKEKPQYNIETWDSFTQVVFLKTLEQYFDIKFQKQDLISISSLNKAALIVEEYLKNQSLSRFQSV